MSENYDKIIQLAWCDKTSFDEIKRKFNLSEDQVINIMRLNLKLKSFKLWRKRVGGRRSKHQKKSNILSNFEKYKVRAHEVY